MITLALILNLKIAWAQLFTKIPKVAREIEGNLKKYKGWNVKTTDGNSNSLFYVAIAYITEMHNKKIFVLDWVITYFWPSNNSPSAEQIELRIFLCEKCFKIFSALQSPSGLIASRCEVLEPMGLSQKKIFW